MTLAAQLKEWDLVTGRVPPGKRAEAVLLKLCHAGRLRGGLSISLQVTPDEAIGPLTHAMGGPAQRLKVLDVRRGASPHTIELEVQFTLPDPLRDDPRPRVERWDVEGVRGLVHNVNDLFRDVREVRSLVVLGEWEDMLQVWALEGRHLRALMDDGTLEFAQNGAQLRALLEG